MKNIVLTGATRGIGRAVALKFAEKGWNVAFCSRQQQNINTLLQDLKSVNKFGEYIGVAADVARKDQVTFFADKIMEQWEEVDILVNNAGIFVPDNVLDAEDGALENIMNINFFSAYYMTRALKDLVIRSYSKEIFNLCSVASLQAYPNGNLYAISKHALLGFSRALREEMKPHNVKVTSVYPGATYTDSWSGADIPEERFMKAEDVAEIIFDITTLSSRAVVEDIVLRPMKGDI